MMRIGCPACKAQYVVPNASIGAEGRKVKCFKCLHIWFAKPDNNIELDESFYETPVHKTEKPQLDNSSRNFNLPQIIPQKTPIFWKITPAICIILTFFCFFILQPWHFRQFEITNNIYKTLGLSEGELLNFQNVKIEKTTNTSGMEVTFSGYIINNSTSEKLIPHLKFSTLDAKESVLLSKIVSIPHKKLKPGESYPIKFTFDKVDPNAMFIAVDVGSKFELWLR